MITEKRAQAYTDTQDFNWPLYENDDISNDETWYHIQQANVTGVEE